MPRAIPLVFCLFVSLSAARYSLTQSVHVPVPQNIPQSQNLTVGSRPSTAPTGSDDEIQRQQAIAANLQRQVEIRRDAEKMAALMQDLRSYLARSDQGVMSVEAIKKAEEIEKLAHRVKSKMKQSF